MALGALGCRGRGLAQGGRGPGRPQGDSGPQWEQGGEKTWFPDLWARDQHGDRPGNSLQKCSPRGKGRTQSRALCPSSPGQPRHLQTQCAPLQALSRLPHTLPPRSVEGPQETCHFTPSRDREQTGELRPGGEGIHRAHSPSGGSASHPVILQGQRSSLPQAEHEGCWDRILLDENHDLECRCETWPPCAPQAEFCLCPRSRNCRPFHLSDRPKPSSS